MSERNRTIAAGGSHEIIVRRSRFICSLQRTTSEEEGKMFIAAVRKQFWDASHNCSAWVIGTRGELQRSNDDGEPAGTAGQPMLSALNHHGLTDTTSVVTRYFGGTLLGAGGLVRAYGQAVIEAIGAVGIVERRPMQIMHITCPHTTAGKLDFALRGSPFHVAEIDYADQVTFELHIQPEQVDPLQQWLAETTNGQLLAAPVGIDYVEVPVSGGSP